MKLKFFCTVKETINRVNIRHTEWEKIFANHPSDKESKSKIFKDLLQLNSNKTNDLVKKWAKGMNRHFSKEYKQMAYRYMKRGSTS